MKVDKETAQDKQERETDIKRWKKSESKPKKGKMMAMTNSNELIRRMKYIFKNLRGKGR